MTKLRITPARYVIMPKKDSMPTTQLVNPELRKRNEERFKRLVDTLNKNTRNKDKTSEQLSI